MEEQFVSWQYSHTYVVHEEEPGTVQRKLPHNTGHVHTYLPCVVWLLCTYVLCGMQNGLEIVSLLCYAP